MSIEINDILLTSIHSAYMTLKNIILLPIIRVLYEIIKLIFTVMTDIYRYLLITTAEYLMQLL